MMSHKTFATARAVLAQRSIPLHRSDPADGPVSYFLMLKDKPAQVSAGELRELLTMLDNLAELERQLASPPVALQDGRQDGRTLGELQQLRADLKARFALADAALAARGW